MSVNFLSPLGFQFTLRRAPTIETVVQTINVPGINLGGPPDVPTPFKSIPYTPDHLTYDDLQLSFRVDEEMKSYLEIYDWLKGIAFPEDFAQFRNLSETTTGDVNTLYSDATLVILNSKSNPLITVSFEDIFPTNLDQLQFDVASNDLQYITCTASFKFKAYSIST